MSFKHRVRVQFSVGAPAIAGVAKWKGAGLQNSYAGVRFSPPAPIVIASMRMKGRRTLDQDIGLPCKDNRDIPNLIERSLHAVATAPVLYRVILLSKHRWRCVGPVNRIAEFKSLGKLQFYDCRLPIVDQLAAPVTSLGINLRKDQGVTQKSKLAIGNWQSKMFREGSIHGDKRS